MLANEKRKHSPHSSHVKVQITGNLRLRLLLLLFFNSTRRGRTPKQQRLQRLLPHTPHRHRVVAPLPEMDHRELRREPVNLNPNPKPPMEPFQLHPALLLPPHRHTPRRGGLLRHLQHPLRRLSRDNPLALTGSPKQAGQIQTGRKT
ncbi:hypothetical protein CR513_38753, partial [Mucuna pruriens]